MVTRDFLKTRAGFAYVRECIKCGVSVGYATNVRPLHLYEVEFYEGIFRGTLHTTDLEYTLGVCRVQRGSVCVREYNRATCQYDTVYVGTPEALCSWVTDGDLRVTGYDEYEEFEIPLDVYNTDTCAGDARKLVYNQYTYKLNHKPLYSVVEDVAANPSYSWLVVNVHACASEVLRASAVFMRDVCGATLPI